MHGISLIKLILVNFGSSNGLSLTQFQAITSTNVDTLIGPLATNTSEILINLQKFSFLKVHLKIASVKWRPFCIGLKVLKLG